MGKSTLLRQAPPFREWRFQTMDDFDTLGQAQNQPEALWAGTDRIILDEVQKAPEILPAIKQAVDNQPGRFRFVLSGSANLLLMRQVNESLAGRAVYFILSPMTLGEINQNAPPNFLANALVGNFPLKGTISASNDLPHLLLRGLMPALLQLSTPESWVRWWDGYIRTYLERDLRQISQIDSLLDFRRVMELLALRTGQLLNQAEVSRDSGISQPTVHRYINLLETTHLFTRLPAFTRSKTTRLLKSPKAMWTDPGLAIHLSGYFDKEELSGARELGSFFEAFIYHHLKVLADLMTPPARLYFWRTRKGIEVDFVLEYGRQILAVEVKQTQNPGYRDTKGLQSFLEHHPEALGGILLHGGNEIRRLGENIMAVPWTLITG